MIEGAGDVRYKNVLRACTLRNRDSDSLGALVRQLPGVYPSDVMTTVNDLTDAGALTREERDRLLAPSITQSDHRQPTILPVPHPLDFEWRFARPTLVYLADVLVGQHVALLGCPSLFEYLATYRRQSLESVVLIDRNPLTCASLRPLTDSKYRVISSTLPHSGSELGTFDAVIADPPWYPEMLRVFLHTASEVQPNGSLLLMCMPGLGTRPGVESERSQVLGFAEDNGFSLVQYSPGAVRYESPPFEVLALRAAGIHGIPLDWRAGDLATFMKVGPHLPFNHDVDSAEHGGWNEVTIGPVRVRLRVHTKSVPIDGRLELSSLVSGDVLDSVSRRDPRRAQVDVWTTTNRVFGCSDPSVLFDAADSLPALGRQLAGATTAQVSVPTGDIGNATAWLSQLAAVEVRDLRSAGWMI